MAASCNYRPPGSHRCGGDEMSLRRRCVRRVVFVAMRFAANRLESQRRIDSSDNGDSEVIIIIARAKVLIWIHSQRANERANERASQFASGRDHLGCNLHPRASRFLCPLARSQSSAQRATRFLSAKSQLAQVNLLLRNDAAKSDRSAAAQCNDAAAH